MLTSKIFGQNIAHPHLRGALSIFKILIISVGLLSSGKTFAQKPDKVQQAIDGIKAANYCEDQDYHTDGQRVVWVKSYKNWVPSDLCVMKKEAHDILKFFGQAIQHNRYDVLEQLLPDYYRVHGGVKMFAADIVQTNQKSGTVGNKDN